MITQVTNDAELQLAEKRMEELYNQPDFWTNKEKEAEWDRLYNLCSNYLKNWLAKHPG